VTPLMKAQGLGATEIAKALGIGDDDSVRPSRLDTLGATLRPMPKRPPQDPTASDLTARERHRSAAGRRYERSGDQRDCEGPCRTRRARAAFPYGPRAGGAEGRAAGAVTHAWDDSEQKARAWGVARASQGYP
jgi:hypothetical protein